MKYLLFILISLTSFSQNITGVVTKIYDGDSIILNHSTEVELYQIDAPELGQRYGHDAKQFLKEQIFNKKVRVNIVGTNHYGQKLGVIFIRYDNINELILENGYAWIEKKYKKYKSLGHYESYAKKYKLGLWRDKKPVAPWVYRKGKK